jgi:hypothetical protein
VLKYGPLMDAVAQSNMYLNELAQFGSNPMRFVSDSTEFGSALREFELARMVSESEACVSGLCRYRSRAFRYRTGLEQRSMNQSSAARNDFSISNRSVSISIRNISTSIRAAARPVEPADDRFQTSESSFAGGDIPPHAIPRSFLPDRIDPGRTRVSTGGSTH